MKTAEGLEFSRTYRDWLPQAVCVDIIIALAVSQSCLKVSNLLRNNLEVCSYGVSDI